MTKFSAIIHISRPINFLITFASVIIAIIISLENKTFSYFYVFAALTMSFACSAGNIINDIFDLEIDIINKPNRILPQKILTINFAKILYFAFVIISLSISFLYGSISVLFLCSVNLLLFFYSKKIKKLLLFDNITVSLLTASALVYGGIITENVYAIIIPAMFAFLTTLIREIIKDAEDIEGDKKNNIVSFPNRFGLNNTYKLISVLIIILFFLTLLPFIFGIYKYWFLIIMLIIINPILVYIMFLLHKNTNKYVFKKTSNYMKIIMVIGLIAIYLGIKF